MKTIVQQMDQMSHLDRLCANWRQNTSSIWQTLCPHLLASVGNDVNSNTRYITRSNETTIFGILSLFNSSSQMVQLLSIVSTFSYEKGLYFLVKFQKKPGWWSGFSMYP